jgi:D,D-heptose 1,7-bisphosphate phosphatase
MPKTLVPVAGRPLLERQLEFLETEGIQTALILVGYGADEISDFVAHRENNKLDIALIDDERPRGTAGAVFAAWDDLDDEFLVIYGDTILDVDLERFYRWHASRPDGVASLLVHPNDHPIDSDLVQLDPSDRITGFLPYPRPPGFHARNLVNAALYWIRKEKLAPWRTAEIPSDFGRDLFPQILEKHGALYGYRSTEYIKDAGTPGRLDRVAADVASGRVAAANLRRRRPAIFLDRDGTLNIDHGFIRRPQDVELIPGAADAVRRINAAGYLAVVVTNQSVIARGDCTESDMEHIHARLEELLGEGGGYLDRIYYCPHHPDAGFPNERPELKFSCDCRKPQTGMIRRAADDNSIHLSRSFVIGDTTADFLMAERAGLRSVGVATGSAGLDEKYPAEPNYTAADVASAVTFILDVHPRLVGALKPLADSIKRDGITFVGGVARSGKSTLAHALADCLAADNVAVRVIALDHWIRSLAARGPGVLGRYEVDQIRLALSKLAPPRSADVTLDLPFYFRKTQSSRPRAQSVTVKPDELIIVEGTIALLCSSDIPGTRIYVQSEPSDRRSRFFELQRSRGKSLDEAERLFVERDGEETAVVEDSRKRANVLVTFTPPFEITIAGL